MSGKVARTAGQIAASNKFQNFILVVIVLNGVILGIETYDGAVDRFGHELHLLNQIFLGVFVVEIAVRLVAFGSRPDRFFREGWNIFDFLIVAASFAPGIRENATLLRLVRLLRVLRLISVMPDLRVILTGLVRSLKPIGSMGVLMLVIVYIYGMVGWVLFGDHDPENWGTIGVAMLTLFEILTLEGWIELLNKAMELSSWSCIYFITFVLFGTFVLLNIVIGIVINSMEEARALYEAKQERMHKEEVKLETIHHSEIVDQLKGMRLSLQELEQRFAVQAGIRASDEPGGSASSAAATEGEAAPGAAGV